MAGGGHQEDQAQKSSLFLLGRELGTSAGREDGRNNKFPFRLENFEKAQSTHLQKLSTWLVKEWPKQVARIVKLHLDHVGKGWFSVESLAPGGSPRGPDSPRGQDAEKNSPSPVGGSPCSGTGASPRNSARAARECDVDESAYDFSKLKRLLFLTKLIMEDALLGLLEKSLEMMVVAVRGSASVGVPRREQALFLLDLKAEQCAGLEESSAPFKLVLHPPPEHFKDLVVRQVEEALHALRGIGTAEPLVIPGVFYAQPPVLSVPSIGRGGGTSRSSSTSTAFQDNSTMRSAQERRLDFLYAELLETLTGGVVGAVGTSVPKGPIVGKVLDSWVERLTSGRLDGVTSGWSDCDFDPAHWRAVLGAIVMGRATRPNAVGGASSINGVLPVVSPLLVEKTGSWTTATTTACQNSGGPPPTSPPPSPDDALLHRATRELTDSSVLRFYEPERDCFSIDDHLNCVISQTDQLADHSGRLMTDVLGPLIQNCRVLKSALEKCELAITDLRVELNLLN